jgi:hypothetical protein
MSALPEKHSVAWPDTGEEYDLATTGAAAALSHRAAEAIRYLKELKGQADAVLRAELERVGQSHLLCGDLEVFESTGKPTYDADEILNGLIAAGMDAAAAEALFEIERKVSDGTELNKIANRVDKYRMVVAAGTKRSRGSLTIKTRPDKTPAPQIPEAFHREVVAQARVEREAEAEANDLGI